MTRVTRELLNDWLQNLQGVPVDSPAMQVAHGIVALLNDDVPAKMIPQGYVMTTKCPYRYADMIGAGWTDNLLIEYGHMKRQVIDVLAAPIHPGAVNYRIQIKDAAWIGTLDEWRALLQSSATRAAKLTITMTVKDGEWEGTLDEWRARK